MGGRSVVAPWLESCRSRRSFLVREFSRIPPNLTSMSPHPAYPCVPPHVHIARNITTCQILVQLACDSSIACNPPMRSCKCRMTT